MDKSFARTRQEAKDRGLTRYFTGEPCLRGHYWYRWTKSAQCTKCVRKTDPFVFVAMRAKVVRQRKAVRRGRDQALAYLGFPPSKTLREARAAGDKFYFNGKPCRHGHVGPRYTSVGYCVACRHDIYIRRRTGKWDRTPAHPKPPPVLSLRESRASNVEFYYTGKPCIRGHLGPRYTKSGGCVPCRHEKYLREKENSS